MINLDFTQLKDIPAWVILAGIAVYLIKANEGDKKFYRGEAKEDKKNFLSALKALSADHKETKQDIKDLKEDVRRISDRIK